MYSLCVHLPSVNGFKGEMFCLNRFSGECFWQQTAGSALALGAFFTTKNECWKLWSGPRFSLISRRLLKLEPNRKLETTKVFIGVYRPALLTMSQIIGNDIKARGRHIDPSLRFWVIIVAMTQTSQLHTVKWMILTLLLHDLYSNYSQLIWILNTMARTPGVLHCINWKKETWRRKTFFSFWWSCPHSLERLKSSIVNHSC